MTRKGSVDEVTAFSIRYRLGKYGYEAQREWEGDGEGEDEMSWSVPRLEKQAVCPG